jgi:hypothetical protein
VTSLASLAEVLAYSLLAFVLLLVVLPAGVYAAVKMGRLGWLRAERLFKKTQQPETEEATDEHEG